MQIEIDLNNAHSKLTKKVLVELANKAVKIASYKRGIMLGVTIVSDKKIQELNREYRNKDAVTDVLSFSFRETGDSRKFVVGDESNNLGEIYISLAQAKRQAEEVGHSLSKELQTLFVHGLMHLLGYDHEEDHEAKIMENLEKKILKHI